MFPPGERASGAGEPSPSVLWELVLRGCGETAVCREATGSAFALTCASGRPPFYCEGPVGCISVKPTRLLLSPCLAICAPLSQTYVGPVSWGCSFQGPGQCLDIASGFKPRPQAASLSVKWSRVVPQNLPTGESSLLSPRLCPWRPVPA